MLLTLAVSRLVMRSAAATVAPSGIHMLSPAGPLGPAARRSRHGPPRPLTGDADAGVGPGHLPRRARGTGGVEAATRHLVGRRAGCAHLAQTAAKGVRGNDASHWCVKSVSGIKPAVMPWLGAPKQLLTSRPQATRLLLPTCPAPDRPAASPKPAGQPARHAVWLALGSVPLLQSRHGAAPPGDVAVALHTPQRTAVALKPWPGAQAVGRDARAGCQVRGVVWREGLRTV